MLFLDSFLMPFAACRCSGLKLPMDIVYYEGLQIPNPRHVTSQVPQSNCCHNFFIKLKISYRPCLFLTS